MKRAILLLLVVPVLALGQTANIVASDDCFTSVGQTAADSLGEGTRPCGNGTSACNVPMILTAGSTEFSIIGTPGIPLPNSACAKSLQFTKAGVSAYLVGGGAIPLTDISTGGIYDLTAYIYISAGPPSGATLRILGTSVSGSSLNSRVQLNNNAGQLRINATDTGSSNSAYVNVSANTWYRIDLHGQSGANACWMAVSATNTAGAHQTFTCNTTYVQVRGIQLGGTDTSASGTVVFGKWKIKTQVNGTTVDNPVSGRPSVYMDFENSTDGTTLTTSILNAGIKAGGVGVWSGSSSSMKVSAACERQLTSPVGLIFGGGTAYDDSGSTRGIKYDLSTATASSFLYSFNATSPVSSLGYWFLTDRYDPNDITDGFYSFNAISTASGTSDFVSTMIHGGLMYLESAGNPNGAPDSCTGCTVNGAHTGFAYAPNTWYWITAQFVQDGEHSWAIYDTSGNLLAKMTKAGAATTATTWRFGLGRGGDAGGGNALPANYYCTDDVVIDYLTGTWPLTPQ